MVKSNRSSDLMKRLSLVHCVAALYRVYGRKYDIFMFNALIQFVCDISEEDVDILLNQIVTGKLNPAFFDSYEV